MAIHSGNLLNIRFLFILLSPSFIEFGVHRHHGARKKVAGLNSLISSGFNNTYSQADFVVRRVFVASDELGQKGSTSIHQRCYFLCFLPRQIAHFIDAEQTDTYCVWVIRVVWFTNNGIRTNVGTPPLAYVVLWSSKNGHRIKQPSGTVFFHRARGIDTPGLNEDGCHCSSRYNRSPATEQPFWW